AAIERVIWIGSYTGVSFRLAVAGKLALLVRRSFSKDGSAAEGAAYMQYAIRSNRQIADPPPLNRVN
ncbi:MAG TPA: hypothetical protein VMW72_25285, partial [Sedimentisphaerales bacterium]|nr:hypothetical protein [Sedimentisphaerales bacterium]